MLEEEMVVKTGTKARHDLLGSKKKQGTRMRWRTRAHSIENKSGNDIH